MDIKNILSAFFWFAVLGGGLGALLALASKIFAVQRNERVEKIEEVLPGANCGGCGYRLHSLRRAMDAGIAKANACTVGGQELTDKISEILGIASVKTRRMRAQVMCSGTSEFSKHKYIRRCA